MWLDLCIGIRKAAGSNPTPGGVRKGLWPETCQFNVWNFFCCSEKSKKSSSVVVSSKAAGSTRTHIGLLSEHFLSELCLLKGVISDKCIMSHVIISPLSNTFVVIGLSVVFPET